MLIALNSAKRITALILIAITIFFISSNFIAAIMYGDIEIKYDVKIEEADTFQNFFYTGNKQNPFSEENSIYHELQPSDLFQQVEDKTKYKNVFQIRFDLGTGKNNVVIIKSMEIGNKFEKKQLSPQNIKDSFNFSGVSDSVVRDEGLRINVISDDPYMFTKDFLYTENMGMIYGIAAAFTCIATISLITLFSIKPLKNFLKDIINNRKLILSLSVNDFKTKYAGSYFGVIWAFIQPIVTIAVYTFVFQVGFRSGNIGNIPFVLWLTIGLVPWFFYSDSLNNASGCLIEYSYLVKKVVFNLNILPLVKVISSLYVHLFFVLLIMLLSLVNNVLLDLYILQIVYYTGCVFMLSLATSFFTSAVIVFFKDLGQVISIFLQVGVWMTPIMWNFIMIPPKYLWIFKLNPMFYVVQGYRECFIYKVWFWDNAKQFTYFWFIVVVLFFVGALVFRKLKPHFADII